jgi:nucleotide-binding universal stress UspA family protein
MQNILLAFDDSKNAFRAVEFMTRTFTPNSTITLFHVLPDTAILCEMHSPELTDYFVTQQSNFCALEAKKKSLVEEAMKNAKSMLVGAGYPEDHIKTKIETKKSGVARDIIREAQAGYDIIVIGRRGLSGIKEFFIGSVSQKVMHTAKDISVLIVN